jgi:hypothetical protein
MKELITDKMFRSSYLSDYVTSFCIELSIRNLYITIEELSHEEILLS